MPTDNSVVSSLTITDNTVYPWLQTWQWPTYTYPTYTSSGVDYANEVEVVRGEHDAVLRFHRVTKNTRVFVKEITVPLGLLATLAGEGS